MLLILHEHIPWQTVVERETQCHWRWLAYTNGDGTGAKYRWWRQHVLHLHGMQWSRRKQFRLSIQCHVSTDGRLRQDMDYENIQVTWVIKIAKFLVNGAGGKKMFCSQLIDSQGMGLVLCSDRPLWRNINLCEFTLILGHQVWWPFCSGEWNSLCNFGNWCLVHRFRKKTQLLAFVLGGQKNRLIETVLLSTHNICFGWKIRKLFFSYALLPKSW